MQSTSPETKITSKQSNIIVGIGASAGGLEAIESFFKEMPTDSGMAFVVIQHLSPDYKSMMVELLSRRTDISVLRADDGIEVKPDHIYLIPPKKNLTIFHGKLLLADQSQRDGINLPVDIFFKSLAEDQGEKAVGVILSGTGSDGTRGVRAIKEWGGLVLVQDEVSAKFDGMPRAAASTGVADFILSPSEMPSQLLACLSHPYASRQDRQQQALGDETGLTRLFSLLRAKTKVDFTHYKPSTTNRRIERRIAVTQVPDLESYVRYAEHTPAEISSLYRELLIGVTSFFRDPEVMNKLQEKVLPEVFEKWADRELRFWVAGCSTGEEAYTLAIIAREVMESLGLARDIKIFATDIDRDAVATAGTGVYPESIAADLKPSLLAKYFYRRKETYQVARSLREMVVFAQHNLLKDPPFTRIDLVSCRNLLIYLQTNLQQHALEMFDFSLRPGGILLLGTSETLGEMEDRFEPIDRKARIYRSMGKMRNRHALDQLEPSSRNLTGTVSLPAISYGRNARSTSREQERMVTRLLDTLAASYVPLAVVVNEHLEILYSIGDSRGIFALPSGKAVLEISKMVNRELGIPLATGIQKTFRTGEEIVYSNVRLREGGSGRKMRVRMCPLPGRKNDESLVVVFFEKIEDFQSANEDNATDYDLDEETNQRMQDLELELQFTRENLQATIEELETSNEELQATNEELLASNEELQSTNEELQSTNEELYTVNAEYQNKIIELTEVQNDVENLLSSSRIGTLILDEDLCIRRYSQQATALFNLVDNDIGRPLKHLSHQFIDFDPVSKALHVQRTNDLVEQNVQVENGSWYLVRILPYHIGPKTFSGVVITLVDITPLREVQKKLEATNKTAADIVQHMPSGLFVYKVSERGDLILESGNAAAATTTGVNVIQSIGSRFIDLWPGAQGSKLQKAFLNAYREKKPMYDSEVPYADERLEGVYNIHAFALPGERLAVSFEDITKRKRMEEELRTSEAKYRKLFETMAQGVVYQDADGNIISANPSAERILGLSLDQMLGRTSMDPRWQATSEDGSPLPGHEHPSMIALRTGKPVFGFVMGVSNPEFEDHKWILVNATPEFINEEEKPIQVFTTFEDITERKQAEKELRENQTRLRGLNRLLTDAEETNQMGSWTWEVASDTVTWSDNLFKLFKRDPELGAPSFTDHDPLYTPDSMVKLRKVVEEALEKGNSYEIKLDAVRTDGTIMHCVARGQAEYTDKGTVQRLYGSLQEVQA
jgi:two-component system CheB/CheR fusion protein